jgi:hypothetical protein
VLLVSQVAVNSDELPSVRWSKHQHIVRRPRDNPTSEPAFQFSVNRTLKLSLAESLNTQPVWWCCVFTVLFPRYAQVYRRKTVYQRDPPGRHPSSLVSMEVILFCSDQSKEFSMKKIILVAVVFAAIYASLGAAASDSTQTTVKAATSSLDAKIEAATK